MSTFHTANVPSIYEPPDARHYSPKGFVHCCVTRGVERASSRLHRRYNFRFEDDHPDGDDGNGGGSGGSVPSYSIIAERQPGVNVGGVVGSGGGGVGGNMLSSTYYLFDASRGGTAVDLGKKEGHYIGMFRRVRAKSAGSGGVSVGVGVGGSEGPADGGGANGGGASSGCAFVLLNATEDKDQCAVYAYREPSLLTKLTSNLPPRKLEVAFPRQRRASESAPVPAAAGADAAAGGTGPVISSSSPRLPPPYRGRCMLERLADRSDDKDDLVVLASKEPEFSGGYYRLNFNGRVLLRSIKNIQLQDDNGDVLVQFGKMSMHVFHLDYKAPVTAIQAFALALAQFDK